MLTLPAIRDAPPQTDLAQYLFQRRGTFRCVATGNDLVDAIFADGEVIQGIEIGVLLEAFLLEYADLSDNLLREEGR